MTAEVLAFLSGDPGRIALFEGVEGMIQDLGPADLTVSKTQIGWGNPRKFAFLSLPRAAALRHTPGSLILTLGLDRRVEHPNIAQAVEPYPGRWTHHIPLAGPSDLEGPVRDWIAQAYAFARIKSRRR